MVESAYARPNLICFVHPKIDVPNLQVIKLMQSFKSREYVEVHANLVVISVTRVELLLTTGWSFKSL